MRQDTYQWGRYYPLGIGIGIILGIPRGCTLRNIAPGPAFGVAIGAGPGLFLERTYNPEPLPSGGEQDTRKKLMAAGFTILIIVTAALFGLLYLVLE